jgi:hypothetical protein
MIEIALSWFFIVGTPNASSPFPPSRLGPMTQTQCIRLRSAVPDLPGRCQQAIGMYACETPGRPGAGTACPIFEGDMMSVRTGEAK